GRADWTDSLRKKGTLPRASRSPFIVTREPPRTSYHSRCRRPMSTTRGRGKRAPNSSQHAIYHARILNPERAARRHEQSGAARAHAAAVRVAHPGTRAWTAAPRYVMMATLLEVWPRPRRLTHHDNPSRPVEQTSRGRIEESLGRRALPAVPPAWAPGEGGCTA